MERHIDFKALAAEATGPRPGLMFFQEFAQGFGLCRFAFGHWVFALRALSQDVERHLPRLGQGQHVGASESDTLAPRILDNKRLSPGRLDTNRKPLIRSSRTSKGFSSGLSLAMTCCVIDIGSPC
jgi:hypothetical protein